MPIHSVARLITTPRMTALTGEVKTRRQSLKSRWPSNEANPIVQNAVSAPRLNRKRTPSALAPVKRVDQGNRDVTVVINTRNEGEGT